MASDEKVGVKGNMLQQGTAIGETVLSSLRVLRGSKNVVDVEKLEPNADPTVRPTMVMNDFGGGAYSRLALSTKAQLHFVILLFVASRDRATLAIPAPPRNTNLGR